MADFHSVEANLRESFRVLARGRENGDVTELPGISIASLGVTFQMFNAAFLSGPAAEESELEDRLRSMRDRFASRGLQWSFWVCEDWLGRGVQRRLSRVCEKYRLRLSAEMPGMLAAEIWPATRPHPQLDYQPVRCPGTLRDFRAIGALCFHVPPEWFSEVFDERVIQSSSRFAAWVAYDRTGLPVATAATVRAHGVVGLYNIATVPTHRHRAIAEALTRHVCAAAEDGQPVPLALQSTAQGFRMYERMGFRPVTRILVYNSY